MDARKQTAIMLLATGKTQSQVATEIGVSRMTIIRWNANPDFRAAVAEERARLEKQFAEKLQISANKVQDKAVASMQADLEEFYSQLRQAQKIRVRSGLALITKALRRYKDLPEEAISVKDIAGLAIAGDKLLEKGLEIWAESLSISELKEIFQRESKS